MKTLKRSFLLLTILLLASLACRFTASEPTPVPAATTQASSTPLPAATETALPAPALITDRPRGIFVLADLGGANAEQLLTNFNQVISLDYVAGATIRFGWKDIETSPGQYNFSAVDAVMSVLQTTDKKLNIEVFAVEVPKWLVVQLPPEETWDAVISHKLTLKTAVPWNESVQSAWRAYMQALADHLVVLPDGSTVRLADHPNLMMVDAPIVGLQGLRDPTNALVALPSYKRETFINAAVASVHASRDAFPNKFGFLAFFLMSDSDSSPPLEQALMDRLMQDFNNPGQPTLGFFQENLSDSGPSSNGLGKYLYAVKDRTYILFQALTAWSEPFTGADKVSSGKAATGIQFAYETYDATYVEIYLTDALDPAQVDDLRKWNAVLTGVTPP